MCESKVRKWLRDFQAGRNNVHDDSRSSRSSVITDDMVASVEAKILENRRFAISTLSNDFPEVSRSMLYKIVSEKSNFKKLCSCWVPKLLTEDHSGSVRPNPEKATQIDSKQKTRYADRGNFATP
ncbi:hypothetical protein AVEN_16603-1 [Araneus ventricosus]|uniref:Mos1 transposase HTH domain-containing protein n=1 Tax=Araneus ventricosus TaxID=182803 RepID=A0A4Y2UE14_ARAVE|nr:hypothetical protein AVEN_16603-1 [Araneus ventricosus]